MQNKIGMEYIKPILRVWEVDIGYPREGLTRWYYICTVDGLHPRESKAYFFHRTQEDLTDESLELIIECIEDDGVEDWNGEVLYYLKELNQDEDFTFDLFAISGMRAYYPEEKYSLFWNMNYAPVKLGYDGPPPRKSLFGA
jgi:hypothetical protein